MENQVSELSEREIAERIIHLHENLGLGFRRIAKKLSSDNIAVSKDRAHRLYRKYKPPLGAGGEEALTDEELESLKQQVKGAERKAQLAKEKLEIKKRIANLMVEEAMHNFKIREELFSKEKKLLKFLEKVMPVVDPSLWIDFKNYCSMRGCSLGDAAATAIGESADYEAQLTPNPNEIQKLLWYLKERLKASLNAWKQKEEEMEKESEESKYQEKTETSDNPDKEDVIVELDTGYSIVELDTDYP